MSMSGRELQVDHVGIVVRDLEDAKATIEALFGLTVAEELDARDVLGVRTVFYHLGNISIELLEPSDEVGRRRRLGGERVRVEHICFRVDDIGAAAAELSARGAAWSTPDAVPVGDRLVRFSQPDSTGGVVYQLLEQH
jgi:catechol 2,3-dioxygenase-like lactoylglutathione lyase family enzyme